MAKTTYTERACSIIGCGRRHEARDYCAQHYAAFRRYGDPLERRGIANGEAQRFLEKAAAYTGDRCLEWPYGRSNGYGVVLHKDRRSGKRVMHTASNVVCEMVYGPPPRGKPMAAHSCDNRGCVAPKHLSWSTQRKNLIDAVLRKRTTAKVTPAIVRRMRRCDGKMPRRQIAHKFSISVTQTHRILDYESWKHLE